MMLYNEGDCLATYYRVSKSDEDGDGESNSISNQRKLVQKYIADHDELSGFQVIEFVDDGYSGTNFERPGMNEMLSLTQKGHVKCVVVKDLSRFGRDYVTVGDYLEHIFPFMGIRFLSVNEGFDSDQYIGNIPGLEITYKSLFNEFYSVLLSGNVKTSLYTKWETGECIGCIPYGYEKVKGFRNKLFIDPMTSEIVKEIFLHTVNGVRKSEIARIMNERGILTPGDYRKDKKHNLNKESPRHFWTASTVACILKNEKYTGVAIAGKYRRPEIGKKYAQKVPREKWHQIENAHPALVSKEVFEMVQQSFQAPICISRREDREKCLFTGILTCGCCGHNLSTRKTDNKNETRYYCNYSRFESGAGCSDNAYTEEELIERIFPVLQIQIQQIFSWKKLSDQAEKAGEETLATFFKRKKNISAEIEKLKACKIELYKCLRDHQITESEYLLKKKQDSRRMEKLSDDLMEIEQQSERIRAEHNKPDILEEFVRQIRSEVSLTRELLLLLIERIYIWDIGKIEMKMRYTDEYGAVRTASAPNKECYRINAL